MSAAAGDQATSPKRDAPRNSYHAVESPTSFIPKGTKTQVGIAWMCLALYPVWFMWTPLTSPAIRHLGLGTSDINAAILQAEMLRHMAWPWSWNTFTNAPTGESFWRFASLTQTAQNLFLWLTTRVLPASNSVALLVVVGWIVTGFSVYLCSRRLGAGPVAAVAVGVAAEALPWLQQKAANHTSYMFIGLVLLGWILLLDVITKRRGSVAWALVSVTILVALTDTYLLYFMVFGAMVLVVFSVRSWPVRWGAIGLSTLLLTAAVVARDQLEASINRALESIQHLLGASDRMVSIASSDELSLFSSSLGDYVRPDPEHLLAPLPWYRGLEVDFSQDFVNYAGVLLILVGILGLALAWRRRPRTKALPLAAVLVAMLILSINTRVRIGSTSIPMLADVASLFMPGARVFSRAGMFVELLVASFAGVGLSALSTVSQRRWRGAALASVVWLLIIIDLNPAGHHNIVDQSDRLSPMRTILGPESRLLILPAHGPWYLRDSYLLSSTVNALIDNSSAEALEARLSTGDPLAICALAEQGVTHVLGVVSSPPSSADATIDSGLLKQLGLPQLATASVVGTYSGYNIDLALFGVPATTNEDCR